MWWNLFSFIAKRASPSLAPVTPMVLWISGSSMPFRKKQYGLNLDSLSDGHMPAAYMTKGYVNRLTGCAGSPASCGRCIPWAVCDFAPVEKKSGRECGSTTVLGCIAPPGSWLLSISDKAPEFGPQRSLPASATWSGSSLVDYGTAVEDSSILPYTYVGGALDLAHAVVDGNRLVNLSRNVAVTVDDPKIIGRTSSPIDCDLDIAEDRSKPCSPSATAWFISSRCLR